MQQTGKIVAAVLIIVMVSACASSKKYRHTIEAKDPGALDYEMEMSRVIENNFVAEGFVVQKGTVELRGTPIEGEFSFNAKVNSEGDMVLSVRGPLGIELARFLTVGNEVCLIERLGRTVYLGKKDEVMRKYGLPEDFTSIIFGDTPDSRADKFMIDSEGKIILDYSNELYHRIITICPEVSKICSQSIISTEPEAMIEFGFSEFRENKDKKYPGEITIEEKKKMFLVRLKIEQLELGYAHPIEFIVPAYRREVL